MSKKILVIGSSNTDMTIKSPRLPAPGETILGGTFVMGPGGKGANQAVAASRLGGDVTFICKVGRDMFGENAVKGYQKEGIDTSHTLYSDQASGTALILVDDSGENCIAVAPGANGDLSPADIDSVADVIKKADYLILQLEIPVESVLRAAKIAHEAGVYVILNPAPACKLPEEIFKYISLITPNQTESALMTGIEVKDEASRTKAIESFHKMGVKDVIVTLGSKGSLVCQGNEQIMVEALKVKAVDATAAGDTFCGAVCVALSEGKTLEEAARFATKASALTVQKMGAQSSIPYITDIK
ncbi:MAG: ribokinase [Bacteroidales bacterium]|jgi:ribokinase|nr:ribokinase [Bacteroidales bacterium]